MEDIIERENSENLRRRQITYVISKEYTNRPGGRFADSGLYSGEDFKKKLIRLMRKAKREGKKVVLDFDGGFGYGNSFLEESFGGLVRSGIKKDEILKTFVFKSKDEPSLVNKVRTYIMEANNEK